MDQTGDLGPPPFHPAAGFPSSSYSSSNAEAQVEHRTQATPPLFCHTMLLLLLTWERELVGKLWGFFPARE